MWMGRVWNNSTQSGNASLIMSTDALDYDWGAQSPHAVINTDYFSVEWSRTFEVPTASVYRISLYHDDGVRLWIDGVVHVDEWLQSATMEYLEVPLGAGTHTIELDYYELDGGASISLQATIPPLGACQPQSDGVILYSLPNFQGACLTFRRDHPDFNLVNFNDAVQSIWIRGNAIGTVEVSLYQHTYYNGTSQVLTTSVADLGSQNQQPSSIRVRTLTDAFESDNTCGQARPMPIGALRQHHTFPMNDPEDWTQVDVNIGTAYTFRTEDLGSNADTVLTLYRGDCTTMVATNDDDGSGGRASRVTWVADAPEIWVQIRPFATNNTGPGSFYDLTVAP